ncbi:MAG: hypothetical protein J5584_05495 [Clostridia bacterium]|nr:hypothetical protein [Clostridia bacterium]
MNGRQRSFLRDIAKTASLLAVSLEAEAAAGGQEPFYVLLWHALPFLPSSVRAETEGLLRGAATDDCFEISDWFEGMRCAYGKYSQVLTLCQLLCCAWRSYGPDRGAELYRCVAELLRLLAAAVTAGVNSDRPPELSGVWRSMIKHRRYLFGDDPGTRRRLLLGLECSIGKRRSDRPYRQLVRAFLAKDAGCARSSESGKDPGIVPGKRSRDGVIKLYLGLVCICAEPVN